MENRFDVIVIGVGSMGSATCYALARRGLRVLGLERFTIPNEMGSHGGQSRIIRKAYFEHPDYVPLLHRSYEGWSGLEASSGVKLYHETGLLYTGRPSSLLLKGVRDSAKLHDIPLESIPSDKVSDRFPAFRIADGYDVLFEPKAGFIIPDLAITTFVKGAEQSGAVIRQHERVIKWLSDGSGVSVTTENGHYTAEKLVITAGPWAYDLIPELKSQLKVTRQTFAWFMPEHQQRFTIGNFPCWLVDQFETGAAWYGLPMLPSERFGGPQGLKVGQHNPGAASHPDQVDRTVKPEELAQLIREVDRFFPGATQKLLTTKVCLYTYSPDENFIIDKLPDNQDRVVFAAGFSGHGFKFLPVIGEVLADLSIEGRTSHPVGFLSMARLGK